jgi:hypothetical protein
MSLTDPDAILGAIRHDILAWEKAEQFTREEWEAAERVTRSMAELDAHLTEGGLLPREWLHAGQMHDVDKAFYDLAIQERDSYKRLYFALKDRAAAGISGSADSVMSEIALAAGLYQCPSCYGPSASPGQCETYLSGGQVGSGQSLGGNPS